MRLLRNISLLAGTALVMAGIFFYVNNGTRPLPVPPPLEAALPEAHPPHDMAVFQIATGANHRTAAFGYRGGSFFEKRDFSMSVVLVKHPKGDLLIDAGFGREVKKHFAGMPWYFRMVTNFEPGIPAVQQLEAIHYPIDSIKAILLTHAHWDHVSGLPDFAGIPVMLCQQEWNYVHGHDALSALAREFKQVNYVSYSFRPIPYLGFPESYDYYGDGAIVIVPCPGHTPGSVIIFLNLPDGKRYAMIGDLAWQTEGVLQLEERPLIQSWLGDADRAAVRQNLQHMYAIHQKYPEIQLVPAHDPRAFKNIPMINALK